MNTIWPNMTRSSDAIDRLEHLLIKAISRKAFFMSTTVPLIGVTIESLVGAAITKDSNGYPLLVLIADLIDDSDGACQGEIRFRCKDYDLISRVMLMLQQTARAAYPQDFRPQPEVESDV